MSRRIKGTGSLYWDKSRERWIYKCRYRDNKGVLHTMQASDISKKNIRSKMEKVQLQLNIIEKGIPQYNFKEWTDKWLGITVKNTVKPSTYNWYRNMITYMVNEIPKIELKKITPIQIQEILNDLYKKGGVKKQGLAGSTVNSIRRTLYQCLEEAMNNNLIPKNPTRNTKPIKYVKKEMVVMNEKQIKHFLAVAKKGDYIYNNVSNKNLLNYTNGTRYYVKQFYILINLALATGMRISEIRKLQWDDINLRESYIYVRRTLKTENSKRKIKIDSNLLQLLKEFRVTQILYSKELLNFKNYKNTVFTNTRGNPICIDNFRKRYFNKLVEEANAPEGFTIHCMRHTHATLLLKNGINIKVISARLGHKSIEFTLSTYAHVLDEMEETAPLAWEKIMAWN